MPERRATDHIVNVDIAGPNGVTGRNSRTRPLDSVRGGGKVDVRDNVEIRHAVIVAMPLLHRLLCGPGFSLALRSSRPHSGQCCSYVNSGSALRVV